MVIQGLCLSPLPSAKNPDEAELDEVLQNVVSQWFPSLGKDCSQIESRFQSCTLYMYSESGID